MEDGKEQWVVRFKWEFPWAVSFVPIKPGDPKRKHFAEPYSVTELTEEMAKDDMDLKVDKERTPQ